MHSVDFLKQWDHLLTNLGWSPDEARITPAGKRSLGKLGFDVKRIHTLTTPGGCLAILTVGTHQLPEPDTVVAAFVETTWEVHGLLRWCARELDADAALLIDPEVSWLHRLAERDHCLVCPDGDAIEDRLLPLFAGEADPVAAIRAWERESTEARGRGLRQWLQLWERRLGEACGMETPDARRLIQQLILVSKIRTAGQILQPRGLARAADRALSLLEREDVEESLGHALRAVDLLGRDFGATACERGPTEKRRTGEALARSELTAGALMRSIELLSAAHLAARVWLAAEAEPELQRLSWRLCIESPDPMAVHGGQATPHSAPRMRLDLLHTGYEYVLHVVESALRWITSFNGSLKTEYASSGPHSFQPDFLTLADGGADPAGFITEPIHFTLHHLVDIAAPLPPQNRLLKWLLTLRLIELGEELGLSIERLPELDQYL